MAVQDREKLTKDRLCSMFTELHMRPENTNTHKMREDKSDQRKNRGKSRKLPVTTEMALYFLVAKPKITYLFP